MPAPSVKHLPHPVPGRLRRHQGHVDVPGRLDLAVADVEAVREHQGVARLQVRCDVLFVQLRLHGVGGQDHDHLTPGRGLGVAQHLETVGLGLRLAAAPRPQADDDFDPAVAQVQGMSVALAAVADDRDCPALEPGEIRVVVVVELGHLVVSSSGDSGRGGALSLGVRDLCG